MIIGGRPLAHAVHLSYQPIIYDYDHLTWCVARAELIPRWQNIIKVVKDNEIYPICFIAFYLMTMLIFVFSGHEQLNWDGYQSMLKILQVVFFSTINLKRAVQHLSTAILLTFLFFCALVFSTIVLCCYIGVVQVRFEARQTMTRDELIRYRFQLAGEPETLDILNSSGVVSILSLSHIMTRVFAVISDAQTNNE